MPAQAARKVAKGKMANGKGKVANDKAEDAAAAPAKVRRPALARHSLHTLHVCADPRPLQPLRPRALSLSRILGTKLSSPGTKHSVPIPGDTEARNCARPHPPPVTPCAVRASARLPCVAWPARVHRHDRQL